MRCPRCNETGTRVIDSRDLEGGSTIRRRRECEACAYRFTTYERPEGARLTSLQGAQVLFYPTAIGWHPREKKEFGAAQLDAWRTIQRAHSIANGVYVAAVNRVGYEGTRESGIEFWGNSFVADPFGQIVAQASSDKEETLIVECDPHRIEWREAMPVPMRAEE